MSTCVFHQYWQRRVDEKRMLLSVMASTHGKKTPPSKARGKVRIMVTGECKNNTSKGSKKDPVVFLYRGEHPQNLKIWKKGHSLYGSTNKRPAFQQPIWSAVPVQTCARSICSPKGIKAKGPISTGLSRDRTPFIPPLNALVVANHAVCHLAKKSFWKELAGDEGSVAQVHCTDSVCLFSYSVAKNGQNRSWILNCICSSISELKHNKMAVSLDDALGPGREPAEHSKSARHSFLFCLEALKCTIKSLHD